MKMHLQWSFILLHAKRGGKREGEREGEAEHKATCGRE